VEVIDTGCVGAAVVGMILARERVDCTGKVTPTGSAECTEAGRAEEDRERETWTMGEWEWGMCRGAVGCVAAWTLRVGGACAVDCEDPCMPEAEGPATEVTD